MWIFFNYIGKSNRIFLLWIGFSFLVWDYKESSMSIWQKSPKLSRLNIIEQIEVALFFMFSDKKNTLKNYNLSKAPLSKNCITTELS